MPTCHWMSKFTFLWSTAPDAGAVTVIVFLVSDALTVAVCPAVTLTLPVWSAYPSFTSFTV